MKLTICLAAFIAASAACLRAQDAQAPVVTARIALASCVRDNVLKFKGSGDISPIGLAYLVGLTCSAPRDAYRSALEKSGVPNVAAVMSQVDNRIVAFVVRSATSAGKVQ
jgi:hypothetical protein